MDLQREWKKIESIVDQAIELESNKRISFIKKQCGDNNRIFKKVLELIEAIDSSTGYLEETMQEHISLINEWTEISDTKESSFVGKTIGQYKITRLIEHGGMGSVFEAQRIGEAFEQKVALKIIRRGMDTPTNIARFNREQQILANLHHPNIAQLYDGGITNDGLPYLVMEYVKGTPIDEYCDNKKYSVSERIELFKQVCQTIKHAHKNLIIHRDLKPSNILVTDEGHVKILDFGISKILENDADAIYQTREQVRPVSLGYAAPEQLQKKPSTTSVDTYGLGVLLYQLLVGMHPFDFEELSISDMEQTILHDSAPSPVKRFRNINSQSKKETIAENRSATPAKLLSVIKGDLEAIILKLLLKDPNQRYGSTEELLSDLDRYQNELPVQAQHHNIRYRVTKFVKRHQQKIVATTLLIGLFLGLTAFYTHKITQERYQAELEAEKSERISEFLIDIFNTNDPANSQGDTLTVNKVLSDAEDKIDQLYEQPEVKNSFIFNIGKVYYQIGQLSEASNLLKKAKSNLEKSDNINSDYAEILHYLSLINIAEYDYQKAETALQQSLTIYKELGEKETIKYFNDLTTLAYVVGKKGNLDSANTLYNNAFDFHSDLPDAKPKEQHKSYGHWAEVLKKMGRVSEAKKMMKNTLKSLNEAHGFNHPLTLNALKNLATLYREQDNFGESIKLLKKAMQISENLYGTNNIRTSLVYNKLGLTYKKDHRYKLAEKYYRKSLEIHKQKMGENDPQTAVIYNNLAVLYSSEEDYDKALKTHGKSLEIRKNELGTDHPLVGKALKNMASIYKDTDQLDSAQTYYKKALHSYQQHNDSEDPEIASLLYQLGIVHGKQENWNRTENYLHRAKKIQSNSLTKTHPDLLKTYFAIGWMMEKTKRYEKAEPYYKKVLDIREEVPADDFTRYENTAERLAEVLKKRGRQNRADSLLANLEKNNP